MINLICIVAGAMIISAGNSAGWFLVVVGIFL